MRGKCIQPCTDEADLKAGVKISHREAAEAAEVTGLQDRGGGSRGEDGSSYEQCGQWDGTWRQPSTPVNVGRPGGPSLGYRCNWVSVRNGTQATEVRKVSKRGHRANGV